jgi:hypothetical protein
MTLTTKATAHYFISSLNKNKGKAVAAGQLSGAHWATQADKYVNGNTTIATKAGGFTCKPVTASFSCDLDLTTAGLPAAGCNLGIGINCVTVPAAASVNQKWESKIISSASQVDIVYSAGDNSMPIGGKGVRGAAEAYAKNHLNYKVVGDAVNGGRWTLQGAEGKATVRSVVEAELKEVTVVRHNPNDGVTTTCTKVVHPKDPAIGMSIRISCGERLLKSSQ